MRIVLIGLAIVTMNLPAGVELADAQSHPPRPYCLQAGRGGPGGGLLDCSYYTLQQCLGAVGGGTDACSVNPALGWDRIEGKRYGQPPRSNTRERGY
jgi:Protein of unknown function (DUF3551)